MYGEKRDYPKITIFVKRRGEWTYFASTTWARTCKEAVEHVLPIIEKSYHVPPPVKATRCGARGMANFDGFVIKEDV